MSIARPAAEIEPQVWMFSKSWILPGPILPSASRSIRTLRDGSGLAADFCIEADFSLLKTGSLSLRPTLPPERFTNKMKQHYIHEPHQKIQGQA
jgi:hypothetical protein